MTKQVGASVSKRLEDKENYRTGVYIERSMSEFGLR
jgi:hypothetical protein